MYPYYGQGYPCYPARDPSRCAAPGENCNFWKIMLPVEGGSVLSPFCFWHACRRSMDDGTACNQAKQSSSLFCEDHGQCCAVEDGARCRLAAKIGKKAYYDFCSSRHLCQVKRCGRERKYHDGRYLRFCTGHNCYAGDCDKRIREGEGSFCDRHTCQHAGCFNYAPYRGVDESGTPDRFCNQHKLGTCSRSGCREPQHRRGSGLVSHFCRRHCCSVKTCDGEKPYSQAGCPRHTCLEASCVDVVAQKKCYCERHACLSVGCPHRAVALSRCKNHKCKYASCNDEAGSSGHCREHEGREKSGLKRTRFDLQGTYHPTHDEYYPGPCTKMIQSRRGDTMERRCENPIHAGTNYCSTHLCEIRECQEAKVDAFNYCALHKCTAPACEKLRLNATSVQPWEMPVDNPIQFCHDHTCGQRGCRREGQGLFRLCTRHARCYVRGCNEETILLSACRTRVACRRHAWGSDGGEVVERRRHMRERDRERDRDGRRYDDWGYNIYDSVYE